MFQEGDFPPLAAQTPAEVSAIHPAGGDNALELDALVSEALQTWGGQPSGEGGQAARNLIAAAPNGGLGPTNASTSAATASTDEKPSSHSTSPKGLALGADAPVVRKVSETLLLACSEPKGACN